MKYIKIFLLLVFFSCASYADESYENGLILEAGDSIGVWVMGEPELSVETVISEDGTILMPLIGYIPIAGKTKQESVKAIEDAYRDGYLQKPVVHMALRVRARVYECPEGLSEESDETDGVRLFNDKESEEKQEELEPVTEKKLNDCLMLTVIDAQTKKSIKHADIFFPNNKSRYTDRNGYVKLPFSMAKGINPVTVKVSHKSYETVFYDLDFSNEQALTIRLKKPDYEELEPPAGRESIIETAKSIINDPEDILEAKVSLEFYDCDLKTILKALAARFDLILQIGDDNKKYSLRAEDVTVRELLRSLLLAHDCQYSINNGALNVFLPIGSERKTAKEILFRDMSLKEALKILAGMMKINLFISDEVKDTVVNFYVDSLNLSELLDMLLETNGLKKLYKKSNTYYIVPAK